MRNLICSKGISSCLQLKAFPIELERVKEREKERETGRHPHTHSLSRILPSLSPSWLSRINSFFLPKIVNETPLGTHSHAIICGRCGSFMRQHDGKIWQTMLVGRRRLHLREGWDVARQRISAKHLININTTWNLFQANTEPLGRVSLKTQDGLRRRKRGRTTSPTISQRTINPDPQRVFQPLAL